MIGWLRRRWRYIEVHGQSMAPTLLHGDLILVRIGRTPRPGDLVVFDASHVLAEPELPLLIKRAVAIEADGSVIVRGDNPRSQDSRQFGPVPQAALLGVARPPQRRR